jgi:hypothetical protein
MKDEVVTMSFNCLRKSDRGAADSLCSPRILVAENITVQSTLSLDKDNIANEDHQEPFP